MAIPRVTLSEQEVSVCNEVMLKGAISLKHLAEITGMEHRMVRSRLFKKEFNPIDWPELTTDQVAAFVQALPAIRALRAIEWKLLCAYSGLAKKHAYIWVAKVKASCADREDFEQEAFLALLDAIYTYTQSDTKFITYAWWVIRNRLANIANKTNTLGALTNEALKLVSRFEEAKVKFNRPATDDEVFQFLKFTEDEIQTVKEASVKCLQDISPTNFGVRSTGEDYTAKRRGIDKETDTVPCNYEIYEALDRANLTPLERKLIDTSLCPHYGWQQEIADQSISSSGKPHSRQRINQILQAALAKVKAAYLRKKGVA